MFESAIFCLALNVYFEARNEPVEGKVAVAQVVMNRKADPRFPDTICGVVYQGQKRKRDFFPIKNKCQFSWYCDGKSDRPKNQKSFHNSALIASRVISGKIPDITNGATHYHADYIYPDWAPSKIKTGKIGRHIFYKWSNFNK